MSGRYQTYPDYIDSGLSWTGEIPNGWKRLKFKLVTLTGKEFTSGPFGSNIGSKFYRDEGVPVIRGNNLSIDGSKPKYIDSGYVYLDQSKAEELVNSEVLPGDMVFTARGSVGQVGLVPLDGSVKWSNAILSANQLRFRASKHDVSSNYLWYLFSSWLIRTQIILNSDSVAQPNLNLGSLKNLHLLMPSVPEQETIANFLDHETAKIDTLIDKQQQLTKLLKEKRKAVISRAVTKGLNPEAPMKDSRYGWLGVVPEHWEIIYSKWLFTERNTKAIDNDEMLTASQKYGVISQNEFMRLENQKVVQVQKGHDILKHVEPNDFVISMRSFQGGIEFCQVRGAVSSAYVPLCPLGIICSSYFKHLFKSTQYIQALQSTTNLVRDGQALRYNNFTQVRLPLPPLQEQKKIAEYLDASVEKIDALIHKANQGIELLKERRTALISAAVTGKIDVRNWQPAQTKIFLEAAHE